MRFKLTGSVQKSRTLYLKIQTPFKVFGWVLILLLLTGLPGCITSQRMMDNINGHYYKYTFAVREATTRKKSADFEKEAYAIHFDPQYNRVNFDFTNKSAVPIHINWEHTLLIVGNDSSHVIHQGTALRGQATQASTLVAPGASIKDFILPLDLIQRIGDSQTIKDIYPEKDDSLSVRTDWIMNQIGQDVFALQLTIMVGDQVFQLPFHFYPIEMQRGATSFKAQPGKTNH